MTEASLCVTVTGLSSNLTHLKDMETNGVELAVTESAVLLQGDSDVAGTSTLRNGEGEAGIAGVRSKVPATASCLASSPAAPQLHSLPLACRQGCSRCCTLGGQPDSTVRRINTEGTGSLVQRNRRSPTLTLSTPLLLPRPS